MHATLNTYVNFNGAAREAMEFYQSVFGGELTITTFGEMHVPGAPADGVMHSQIAVDSTPVLMGSDGMGKEDFGGFSLSLSGDDADELRGYFQKLSEGGKITKPLEKESWGDEFGMFIDKYGVAWMVNIAAPKTS